MARRGGRRGRRRGRRGSTRSKASSSKSKKSKSKRRSTAASKRRRVRSVAKAKRAANRSPSKSKTTKKKSRKPMGRSRHTKGGQHAANKNQNKKARRTVKSVSKALGNVGKKISKGFSMGKAAYGKAIRGAAANAATHIANSQYNKQLKEANWTKRDMSKLTPQQQRKYDRLSKITGRDYSTRIPGMRINLSADALARFGKFQDAGWYKGLTKAFPGVKSLRINKQLYSNPLKKGWHSSQRMGRGHGLKDIPMRDMMMRPEDYKRRNNKGNLYTTGVTGPEPDWLSDLYRSHNISGGTLDQGARDYWSNEAKTKGRDATIQSIIGTSKAQGTYGGRSKKKPMKVKTTGPKSKAKHTRDNRRMIKSLAGIMAGIRGGV